MEAFRIVMPLDFLQPCAGGAASSPHFIKHRKTLVYWLCAMLYVEKQSSIAGFSPVSLSVGKIFSLKKVVLFFSKDMSIDAETGSMRPRARIVHI
jgi:hypothetical protein